MPQSSEVVNSPPSQSASLGMQPWSYEEDAVLLRHALQCGTKQWGDLGRSGQLKRSNKSCCNRYIFLRRKHLEDAAFLQHVSLEGYNQPLYCQDFKQQHQHQLQQQHWRRAEGVGSAELAFGGLSFDECTAVFFTPNVHCHHLAFPPVPPNLSPFASPPLASQAPHFASQAATFSAAAANASTSEFSLAHDAFPVAAASTAAAVHRPLKRPRDDCTSLGGDQPLLGGRESRWMRGGGGARGGGARRGGLRRDGLPGDGVLHAAPASVSGRAVPAAGESSRVQQQAADEALLGALLWEERGQQQQGGVRSRAQRVLWPCVGSKSALPDDVLLGCSSDEPALMQRATLSAPPPTRPHAELPASTPSQFAAPPASTFCVGNSALCCGDFAPCVGDFGEGWLRVGSESALPDDVLLGVCCEDPAFTQCSAPSAAPPTQPHAALPAPMPSLLAAPPGSALRSMSSGMTQTLDGSAGAMQELEYLDARIAMLGNGNSSNHNHSNDKENDNGNGALFLDTPVAHMLLDGRTLTVHLGSGPQQQALAAPGAAGADQPGWAVEQGGTWEGDAQRHQHRQLKGCGHGELERILSHHQPLLPLSQTPMLSAPTQPVLYGVPSALNMPSNPRNSHMQVLIQPRPAMLQQPFPTGGALPALCPPHGANTPPTAAADDACEPAPAAAEGAYKHAPLSTAARASAAVSDATTAFCKLMRETSLCSDPGAPSLSSKRPREGCTGPVFTDHVAASPVPGSTVQRSRSLASGCAQQGKRSRVQPAPWPRIGSESAFPDGVLLGISIKDHMPGHRTPHAALPAPLRSQVTALGGSFPEAKSRCICRTAPHDKCFNRQTPVQPTASCHWLACCSLAPHTPVSPLCLPGPAYHLPVCHPLCAVALRAPDARLPEGS
ncbi:unnamed protein product [Closterium sp. NIES-53]